MRILLLNPPWPGSGIGTRSQNRIIKKRGDLYLQYPILMGYSCARLRQCGYEVIYIDAVRERLTYKETTKRVKAFKPGVIFLETVTPSVNYDYEYLKRLKGIADTRIIVAGPHVTYFGSQCLKECPSIDVVIKGDYDTRILEVVESLGNIEELKKIKGITFKINNHIIDTGPSWFSPDLDKLPFPDRDTIPFQKYGEAFYNLKPYANMLTTRGCPNRCNFCVSANIMEGVRWRERSIKNVMKEIKFLVGKYRVREINFDDATFNIRRERVMRFCKELKKNHLKILWICNCRVDNIDYEMLKEMRSAGCKLIRYGIESADERVLKYMNKNITVEQMKKAFILTRQAGILALGGFMFGFPVDTRETMEKTIGLMKKLKPDMVQASIPMPYPGTRMYEQVKAAGQLNFDSWEDFDMTQGSVVKMQGITREEMRGILSRVYKEFYLRPQFVLQTLFHIRRPSDVTRILRSFLSLISLIIFHKSHKNEGG